MPQPVARHHALPTRRCRSCLPGSRLRNFRNHLKHKHTKSTPWVAHRPKLRPLRWTRARMRSPTPTSRPSPRGRRASRSTTSMTLDAGPPAPAAAADAARRGGGPEAARPPSLNPLRLLAAAGRVRRRSRDRRRGRAAPPLRASTVPPAACRSRCRTSGSARNTSTRLTSTSTRAAPRRSSGCTVPAQASALASAPRRARALGGAKRRVLGVDWLGAAGSSRPPYPRRRAAPPRVDAANGVAGRRGHRVLGRRARGMASRARHRAV